MFNFNPFKKIAVGAAIITAPSLHAAENPSLSMEDKAYGEMHIEQQASPEKAREYAAVLSSKYGPRVEVVNFTDAVRVFEELQNAYVYSEKSKKDKSEVYCIDTDKDGDIDEARYTDTNGNIRDVVFDGRISADNDTYHLKDNAQEVFINGMRMILVSRDNESKKVTHDELAQK